VTKAKEKIALFIAFVLIVAVFGINVAYAEENLVEVVEERTIYSKTYTKPDGSRQVEIFARPIHYEDEDKNILPIDASLIRTENGYRNAANSWTVNFYDIREGQSTVELSYKGKSICFSPVNANGEVQVRKMEENDLFEPVIVECSVLYADVYPGVDISYTSKHSGIKENIILKEYTGENEFLFSVEISGVTINQNDNGLIFCDNDGEEVFRIADLISIDANDEECLDMSYEILSTEENRVILKLRVNNEFLENAAYPVIVDPTVTVYGSNLKDTFIGSKEPNRNFNSGTNLPYLRTGKDDAYYVRRSLIAFPLTSIPSSAVINSAQLRFYGHSFSGTVTCKSYRVTKSWDSFDATWNNMASFYNSSSYVGVQTNLGSGWYGYNATSCVDAMHKGTISNYGFMLKDDNETNTSVWMTWRSSDYGDTAYLPRLVVDYTGATVSVTSISFSKDTISVSVSGTGSNTITVLPSNATNKSVTWTTSKSSVATVNSSGTVTGVSKGLAKIFATSVSNPSVSKSYWVVVRPSSTKNVSISFHSEETLRAEYSNNTWGTKFVEWHNAIKPSFLKTFGINLTDGGHYSAAGWHDQGCQQGNNNKCASTCGIGSCSQVHHKSRTRMLNLLISKNYPAALNVYMASHVWCYDGDTHAQALGSAYINGKVAVVDARKVQGDIAIVRTTAHELMHCYGCPDVSDKANATYRCSQERDCVMWDYFDCYADMDTMILCNNCYNRFNVSAH